jgi:dCTP deaminase
MTIKSDRWIRRMAAAHGMIEPFEPGQVREGETGRLISYGTSSYGYDVRCADEFKIFTNINSAIVDPKNFDSNSFVDLKSDVCIIPPNSFALARTVEYFRIPRNVLVICLGKSTYARCFSGDTRVALADGSIPTLEEMATRAEQGELFWGYSVGQFGRITVSLLDAPRYIGRDALLEVRLDNDEVIRCTPDHEMVLRDGRLLPAHQLRPGDSLMPLYRQLVRGYEVLYQPSNGHLYPTHRLADEWNLRNGIYPDLPGTHRHHKDFNRLNNLPWNIERLPAADHIRLHNAENYGEDFDPGEHSQSIREAFERLRQEPGWKEHLSEVQRTRAQQFWDEDRYADARNLLRQKHLANWNDERRQIQRDAMLRYYTNPLARQLSGEISSRAWARDDGSRRAAQAQHARQINLRSEITVDLVQEALHRTGSIRGAARLLDCDRTVFRRFPEAIAAFRGLASPRRNHKVVSIREQPGDHDVYCLTVPETGNFALAAGVFVSNCGIIVNVTPLEPEWEGHVTLEFSNTTTLPAKIYANEGVAQILFFESDEVCETSYRDRAGKYQGQRGVTLPKS